MQAFSLGILDQSYIIIDDFLREHKRDNYNKTVEKYFKYI